MPGNEPKAPSVAELTASLRIGHKYLILHLWNDAVARLRSTFPSTLKGLIERLKEGSTDIMTDDTATAIRVPHSENLSQLVEVVMEVELQTVLPALCYRVLVLEPLETIIDSNFLLISDHTRAILLGGRARLRDMTTEHISAWARAQTHTADVSAEMPSQAICRQARYDFCLDASQKRLPIGPWTHELPTDLCLRCHKAARLCLTGMVNTAWSKLPGTFGLPSWEKLQDFQIA